MPINIGKNVGVYEIVSHIGSGGMGDVYRARDPRLGRDVAIKVLPPGVADDPDRMQRFEQEARAAGMLNHPNILSVHDIGRSNGSTYLVTEYLEGETLRQKLGSGPLPLRKTIDYALQLARGLSAAHERGIVHRDLKPENLFVTKDGRLKILDFGLAKLTQSEIASGPLTQLPTSPGTEPGIVLGTMGYMSPEQVRGKIADHRSDIFAFGAILYEMLAGTRAFRGETPADTMSAILQKDPPELQGTDRNIPPSLVRIVHHCLEKDVEQRFHSAGDIAFSLESLSGLSESAVTTAAAQTSARIRFSPWKILAVAFFITTSILAFLYSQKIKMPQRVLHASMEFPENHRFPRGQDHGAAISPNGRYIAFPAILEGKPGRNLWIRDLEKSTAQMLMGTQDAFYPFWSPDNEYVAFFARGKLQKIKHAGGPVQTICDSPAGRGGSWSPGGVIVFSPQPYGPLYQVPSSGGTPKPVTKVVNRENTHRWPSFLPDGKHFLFTNDAPVGIFVGSIDSQEITQLNSEKSNAIFAKSGFLLFVRQGNLVAQPFDPQKKRLDGEAVPILDEKIFFDVDREYAFFDLSDENILFYRPETAPVSQPFWFDRSGKQLEVAGEEGSYTVPDLSPRGDKFSFTRTDPQSGKTNLWVYEFETKRFHRLTYEGNVNTTVWSPDQAHIAYSVVGRIYQKRVASASKEELLFESKYYANVVSWSSDGKFILFGHQSSRGDFDLWILPMFGERKAYPWIATGFDEQVGQFSPDGQLVAYMSDASGQPEVYVKYFSGSDEVWQISTDTGAFHLWSKDGSEILYFSKGKVLSVTVKKGESLSFETPKPLFDVPIQTTRVAGLLPDGRFLVFKGLQSGDRTLRLVVNWNQLLKK